jgi:hypothetical protein
MHYVRKINVIIVSTEQNIQKKQKRGASINLLFVCVEYTHTFNVPR